MQEPICSVSVDLDTVACYEQIHGLPVTPLTGADPIYTLGMPRLLAMFAKYNIKATFFVIGRDAEHPVHAAQLREAIAQGHELANHTYAHPYRLTQLQDHELEAQIVLGAQAIETLLPAGARVEGFRCPGYNISPQVIEILRRHNYVYDSSIFPCPPYLLARATIIGLMALKGRTSRSHPGSAEALWAPMDPYRPAANPHKRGSAQDLWELPMSVAPGVRLPYIGTSIMMYPRPLLGPLTRLTARRHKLLNFELHGVDILDNTDPGLGHLAAYQPDLSVPLDDKMRRFDICFSRISKSHSFRTLRDAVRAL